MNLAVWGEAARDAGLTDDTELGALAEGLQARLLDGLLVEDLRWEIRQLALRRC